MPGQKRSVLNGENRGLPDFLLAGARKHNTPWGPDYIVLVCGLPNESEIAILIDDLILMRCQAQI